jgi:ubiquinone/menaquinone biosynthesis C-methylase UbiE
MTPSDNAIPIEAWNTVLFDKFCRFRFVLTDGLSAHSEHLFAHSSYTPGAHVLDVGCGFGDTTCRIAQQVGPRGRAVGVDCAPRFIELAHREAGRCVPSPSFFVADVETEDLHGPYDHVFSRFGTMFFSRPGAALRNIRAMMKSPGTLTMIVWRRREENPWIHEAEIVVKRTVPIVRPSDSDQVHCGPGPFSMADADTVSAMLRWAGFGHISLERYDTEVCIGQSVDEAVNFAMNLGPAGEIIRLAGDEGRKRKHDVEQSLKELMAQRQRKGQVWMGSSSWIVSARKQ